VRNGYAVWALIVALLSIGVLVGAGAVAQLRPEVGYLEAAAAVPVTLFLALFTLSLAGRAAAVHQRTLGRAGGAGVARFARGLGVLALLLAATAALALGVFGLLVLTD
jgi:hypothetical protein